MSECDSWIAIGWFRGFLFALDHGRMIGLKYLSSLLEISITHL